MLAALIKRRSPLPVLVLLLASATLQAQAAPDADRFQTLADRYFGIVLARPRRSAAFDLLCRHHARAQRMDLLEARALAFVSEHPSSAPARLLAGLILERRQKPERALEAWKQARALAPADWYAPFLIGGLLAARQELDAGAAALEQALDRHPPRAQLLSVTRQLVHCLSLSSRPKHALEVVDHVAQLLPEDPDLLAEIADLVSEVGTLEQALPRWEAVVRAARDDPDAALQAQLAMARLLLAAGRFDRAIGRLQPLLNTLNPEHWLAGQVRDMIEDAYLEKGDSKGLLQHYQARLARDPQDLESRLGMARELTRKGDATGALDAYRGALPFAPKNRKLNMALLAAWEAARQTEGALRQAQHLVQLFPADATILRLCCRAQLKAGRALQPKIAVERARKLLDDLAMLRPKDPSAALAAAEFTRSLARNFASGDSWQRAVSERLQGLAEGFLRAAVRRSQAAPDVLEHLAAFLMDRQRKPEAIATMQRMVAPPNDTAQEQMRLAGLFDGYELLELAAQAARAAQVRDPDNFDILHRLVLLDLKRGAAEQARSWLDGLDARASTADLRRRALSDRVSVYAYLRILEGESARLEEVIKSAPQDSVADLWLLALMQARRGHPRQAQKPLRAALQRDTSNLPLREDLAAMLEVGGNLKGAIAELKTLAATDARGSARHGARIVELQRRLGNLKGALAAAQKMIERNPASARAWRLKAELSAEQGRPQAALRLLRQAVKLAAGDARLRLRLARMAARSGQVRQARAQYWILLEKATDLDLAVTVVRELAALTPTHGARLASTRRLNLLVRRHRKANLIRVARQAYLLACKGLLAFDQGLKELQRTPPDAADELQLLVQLAIQRGSPRVAAVFQKKLMGRQATVQGRRLLSDLLRQSGDLLAARRVWKALLSEGEERILRLEMHRFVRAGAFEAAADLGRKVILAHGPELNGVRMQLVLSLLALGRAAQTDGDLQILLRIADGPRVNVTRPGGVQARSFRVILPGGSSAQRQRVMIIPEVREMAGELGLWALWQPRLDHYLQGQPAFAELSNAAIPELASRVRFLAALLSAARARSKGRVASWRQKLLRSGLEAPVLRSLALASSALGLRAAQVRFCERWMKARPAARLARLLLFLRPFPSPQPDLPGSRTEQRHEARLLDEAFVWLLVKHSDDALLVQQSYMQRLVAIGQGAHVARRVAEGIASVRNLHALSVLTTLVDLVPEVRLQEALLERADVLADGGIRTPQEAQALKDILLWWPPAAAGGQVHQRLLKLLATYLQSSSELVKLRFMPLPGGITFPVRGTFKATQSPLSAACLTPQLDFNALCVLRNVYSTFVASGLGPEFVSVLTHQARDESGPLVLTKTLAALAARGWSEGDQALLGGMDDLRPSWPREPWIRLVRARVLAHAGQPRQALEVLSRARPRKPQLWQLDQMLWDSQLAALLEGGPQMREAALVLSLKRRGLPDIKPFFGGFVRVSRLEPRTEVLPLKASLKRLARPLPELLEEIRARGHGKILREALAGAITRAPHDPRLLTLQLLLSLQDQKLVLDTAQLDLWAGLAVQHPAVLSPTVMAWLVGALIRREDTHRAGLSLGLALFNNRKIKLSLTQMRPLIMALGRGCPDLKSQGQLHVLIKDALQRTGVLRNISRARRDSDALQLLGDYFHWSQAFAPELQLDLLAAATRVFLARLPFARSPVSMRAAYKTLLDRISLRLAQPDLPAAVQLLEKVVFPAGLEGIPQLYPVSRRRVQGNNVARVFVTLAIQAGLKDTYVQHLRHHPHLRDGRVQALLKMFLPAGRH